MVGRYAGMVEGARRASEELLEMGIARVEPAVSERARSLSRSSRFLGFMRASLSSTLSSTLSRSRAWDNMSHMIGQLLKLHYPRQCRRRRVRASVLESLAFRPSGWDFLFPSTFYLIDYTRK